jgi:hypothetical protein
MRSSVAKYELIIEKGNNPVPDAGTIKKAIRACSRVPDGEPSGNNDKRTAYFTGDVLATSTFIKELRAANGGTRGPDPWMVTETKVSGADVDDWSEGDFGGGSPYEIVIDIPQETVTQLSKNGYALYAFKAVQGQGDGSPVVWFKTSVYGKQTTVAWTETYQAYTSDSLIVAGGVVTAENSYDILLGQTLDVDGSQGTGEVVSEQTPAAITVQSMVGNSFTCGISQSVNGSTRPLCAFPLLPNFAVVMAPIQKVLLLFATGTMDTGTVIANSVSQSVMVDLTSANQRGIGFDLSHGGWVTGGHAWATIYPAQTSLVPLLVEQQTTVPGARGISRSLIGSGIHSLSR